MRSILTTLFIVALFGSATAESQEAKPLTKENTNPPFELPKKDYNPPEAGKLWLVLPHPEIGRIFDHKTALGDRRFLDRYLAVTIYNPSTREASRVQVACTGNDRVEMGTVAIAFTTETL